MIPILYIFAAIMALFVALLGLKSMLKLRFCVICASISLAWFGLIVLLRMGLFDNPVFIGILIGQSVVGLYYLFERKAPEKLHLFRLPVLLSLTFAGYSLLEVRPDAKSIIVLLGALWAIFIITYLYREHSAVRGIVSRIIACCKDW